MVDRLDATTLAQIRGATQTSGPSDDASDPARLLGSAARPGLQRRIVACRVSPRTHK